jgi:hypothetical protein
VVFGTAVKIALGVGMHCLTGGAHRHRH